MDGGVLSTPWPGSSLATDRRLTTRASISYRDELLTSQENETACTVADDLQSNALLQCAGGHGFLECGRIFDGLVAASHDHVSGPNSDVVSH